MRVPRILFTLLLALVPMRLSAQEHMLVVLKDGRQHSFPMAEVLRIEFRGAVPNPSFDPQTLAGAWNWVDGQTLVIHKDGKATWYKGGTQIYGGTWELLDATARRFRFRTERGGYVDTVVLSADSQRLDGTNNEGKTLHGSRRAEAIGLDPNVIVGTWNWVDGQQLVLHRGGTATWYKGSTQINEGTWELIDATARRFRFRTQRGGYVDTVVLSADFRALDGTNNESHPLHGTRR